MGKQRVQALATGWNAIEIEWFAAVMPSFANGTLTLWVNGMQIVKLTTIDNDTYTIKGLLLGAKYVDVGTSGQLYIDEFASTRLSYIGELAPPPAPPEAVIQAGRLGATYNYDAAQPHAVSSVVREQVGGESTTDSYTYDANGNMTTRVENGVTYNHAYNSENRLATVTTGAESWSFTYDGDGTRVKEIYTDGTTIVSKYFLVGGSYEIIDTDSVVTTKKHYSMAGKRYAINDGISLTYIAGDHLGSSSIVMDDSGDVLSEQRYMPFGEVRTDVGVMSLSNITETDFRYTGQRNYSGFGLMDYNARFYSPSLGRFTQPDSIVPGGGPQSLNRFSYVNNNPIIFIDPSGNKFCDWDGNRCLIEGKGTIYENYDLDPRTWNYNGRGNGNDPCINGNHSCGRLGEAFSKGAAYVPGVETVDDLLTVTTGCNIACQNGYEEKVGLGWRTVSLVALVLPIGNAALKKSADKIAEFGIDTYKNLRKAILNKHGVGSGLEVHHIIEKIFAKAIGVKVNEILSVVISSEQHKIITNAWRNAIGYWNSLNPKTTTNATVEIIWEAVQDIYSEYSYMLEIARNILGK